MADLLTNLQEQGIYKRILSAGVGELPDYKDGSKVTFYYKTMKCDEDQTVIDDNKQKGDPMELLIGKKFKLAVWETCLKTMKVKEVAKFMVDEKHVDVYPIVSKSLRDIAKPKSNEDSRHGGERHCCGMMSLDAKKSLGYPDLDALMKKPEPLIFVLEMVKVEAAGEFKKDSWAMNEKEKLAAIPQMKDEGNELYKLKQYHDASEKYAEALGMLESLIVGEKPGDEEWVRLEKMKVPFLLNYCQCKLILKDYYSVIEHATTVLKQEPENVKALYRRAKAHVGAWNPMEARKDFCQVAELDSSLKSQVRANLDELDELQKERDGEVRAKLKGKMFR